MRHKALLFDLDGVLTDTAKYHYLAWQQLARELGIRFTLQDNERLKGVSRMHSFEIILEIGGLQMTQAEKEACCEKKNNIYRQYILQITKDETLPGAAQFLQDCRKEGYLIGLGSASKNTQTILDRLEITSFFDVIVDGTMVSKAKPDPEVYLRGAARLGVFPGNCIVFEDAQAGIEAAHAAGMQAVGIGSGPQLSEADLQMAGFQNASVADIEAALA